MLGPRFRYTRGLLRDLRAIVEKIADDDLDRTALAALFPHDPPPPETSENHPTSPVIPGSGKPTAAASSDGQHRWSTELASATVHEFGAEDLAQTRWLHPSQRAAVQNAIQAKASVVTGPPGTGKPEGVAAMLLNQLLRGRPTLFASKNHQAIEAVVPRLNNVVEGGELLIQTASRDLTQRQNYLAKLQGLLARPPRPDAARGGEFRERFSAAFQQQRKAFDELQTLVKAKEEYENLTQQLKNARAQLPPALQADEALRRWPCETTSERIDALAASLREAWRPPKNALERFWQWVRRRQLQARRQAVRERLLSLPNPFGVRPLPDEPAPAEALNDFINAWKAWAEAARLAAAVHNCEQQLAQVPSRDACNRQAGEAQHLTEATTHDWIVVCRGAPGFLVIQGVNPREPTSVYDFGPRA
jgi:hypothetical protein